MRKLFLVTLLFTYLAIAHDDFKLNPFAPIPNRPIVKQQKEDTSPTERNIIHDVLEKDEINKKILEGYINQTAPSFKNKTDSEKNALTRYFCEKLRERLEREQEEGKKIKPELDISHLIVNFDNLASEFAKLRDVYIFPICNF